MNFMMSPSASFPEGSKHIVFGGQATGQSRCHDKCFRIKDMPPVKLDHCVIHVADWDRSNRFYSEVMGAELVPRPVGWAYRFGDKQLNVHGPGVTPAEVARLPVQPGNSDLCFEWQGPIEGAIAHLKAHGIPVELGPLQRFGAKGPGTSVYFRDPDGSLMEFMSYGDWK
jgi:catechol 2,3-dioxygenase-like lactoylglutathione lyase family enzyme